MGADEVTVEIAREMRAQQLEDRRRVERYRLAARGYLEAVAAARIGDMPLHAAHALAVDLAGRLCLRAPPTEIPMQLRSDADLKLREMSDEELERAWDHRAVRSPSPRADGLFSTGS